MNRRNSAEASPTESTTAHAAPDAWSFGDHRFDARRGELTGVDGRPITLRPKTEQLLRAFLAKPGERLDREELMTLLWPHSVVTDDSLVQCVGELRAALGDREQRLIRTLPRRGYRFDGVVTAMDSHAHDRRIAGSVAETSSADDVSTPTAEPGVATKTHGHRPVPRLAAGAGLLVLAAVGAWQAWLGSAPAARPRIDDTITARHVTAVLPLARAHDAPPLREIADRVVDEIAAQMAVHPGMRAIGRRTTEALAEGDRAPRRLAEALHASYAVTGRIAPVPGTRGAAVDVQVLALPEGAVIGSAHFDVETSADAATAGDVGQLVTNLVRAKSGELEATRASAPGHVPDAAELTIIGWEEVNRSSSTDDVLHARARFREALRHDPDSLIALDGLAATYLQAKIRRMPLSAEDRAMLDATLDKVMKLAPNDAVAGLLWAVEQTLEGRHELAIPAIEKANRLVPSNLNGHLMLGLSLLRVGRLDEAKSELNRALRLAQLGNDPRRAVRANQSLAEIALMRGDDAGAMELARRAIASGPTALNSGSAYAVLAAAEAMSGHAREATADMAIFRSRSPQTTIATYDAGNPSNHPAFVVLRARVYEGLRRAGLPER